MREGIHPQWFKEAVVTCASCGTTWTVGATRPQLTVDVCSVCHPFYTGEQRIVDTEGRVDRFMKRLEVRSSIVAEQDKASALPNIPLSELGLGRQYVEALVSSGVATSSDFIERLREAGDEGILEIRGIGRKLLTDIKKKLRMRGYDVPTLQS